MPQKQRKTELSNSSVPDQELAHPEALAVLMRLRSEGRLLTPEQLEPHLQPFREAPRGREPFEEE